MGERREGEKRKGVGERERERACVFSLLSNEKSLSAINLEQKKEAKQRERNSTAPPSGRHGL